MKFTSSIQAILVLMLIFFLSSVKSEFSTDTVFKFLNDIFEMDSRDELINLKKTYSNNENYNTYNNAPFDNFRFLSKDNKTSKNITSPLNLKTITNNSTSNSSNPESFITDLNNPNAQINEWMSISSPSFANRNKYPSLITSDGSQALIDLSKYERVNGNFAKSKSQGANSTKAFWFKARGGYIYYSSTKDDINVLDAIYAKSVNNNYDSSEISNNIATCFTVIDFDDNNWNICASTFKSKLIWLCSIQKYLRQDLDSTCTPLSIPNLKVNPLPDDNSAKIELRRLIQPVIVIPTASKPCNDKWNYINRGEDWECICKEGMEQSPIDLPLKENAVISPLRPMFTYDIVSAISSENTLEGLLTAGDPIKIRYDKNGIRIYHANMGKIVALDGGVFIAEEISFYTPSQHTINGKALDMEVQIVHYGRSKGDIAKQIILSFLFKRTPGAYNKFMDKIDFFNLPSPSENYRELTQDFFIPSILYNSDEDDIPTMQPFSFYTYEGSLTLPPCSERTTHYVAADPLPLSNTVITLFKEALKKSDVANDNGEVNEIVVSQDDGELENNREVQPLNGRSVFLFDHLRYGCVDYKKKTRKIKPTGHYEKVLRDATEFIYVNGDIPSGLPGSFVVSEKEAKGINK